MASAFNMNVTVYPKFMLIFSKTNRFTSKIIKDMYLLFHLPTLIILPPLKTLEIIQFNSSNTPLKKSNSTALNISLKLTKA